MFHVCSLFDMETCVAELQPGYLVSLVPADIQPPTPAAISTTHHLRLVMEDVVIPLADGASPARQHLEVLVDFLRACDPERAVLFHCLAGISRSTAAALVALVLDAEGREEEAALRLRRAAPHAQPNRRVVALADDVLGRDGRLVRALEAMGPPATYLASAPRVSLARLEARPG